MDDTELRNLLKKEMDKSVDVVLEAMRNAMVELATEDRDLQRFWLSGASAISGIDTSEWGQKNPAC
jgi:hypothetical protein